MHLSTCTLIAGIAHCFTLEAVGSSTTDYTQILNAQPYINVAEFSNTVTPNGQVQYQVLRAGPQSHIGWTGPDLDSNGPVRMLWMPGPILGNANPQGNFVVGWNESDTPISPGMPTGGGATEGADNQNTSWSAQQAYYSVVLARAASAAASTTVATTTSHNNTVLPLTSATGFAAGQDIQIDTGTATEFAIVQSVSGNNITLNNPTANTHNSGVAMVSGSAVYNVSLSATSFAGNMNLGTPIQIAAPVGGRPTSGCWCSPSKRVITGGWITRTRRTPGS
jgi:hypothetical protein